MTSRPSYFRTVELAGFMAYMDRVMLKFEYFLCVSISSLANKNLVLQRVNVMQPFFTDLSMFVLDTEACKPLVNVFSDKHKVLDGSTLSMTF